jgi:hypothetical protein
VSPHDLHHALRENLANLRSLALVVDRTAEVVPAEVAGHISVAIAALEAALQHHAGVRGSAIGDRPSEPAALRPTADRQTPNA